MQQSDFDGFCQRGIEARQAGLSYFDNPFHFSEVPLNTDEQFREWTSICGAWSVGWLKEDAGRSVELVRILNRPGGLL